MTDRVILRNVRAVDMTSAVQLVYQHQDKLQIGSRKGISFWAKGSHVNWYLYKTKSAVIIYADYPPPL